MRLRLTRRALGDLNGIDEHLNAHNPAAALRVRAELQATLRLLCDFPAMGRQRRPGVRCLPLPRRPYLIFYRPDAITEELIVLTIRHTARQPEK